MKTILAIIPARGGSKGIPRKNLQKVDGKTLLEHSVNHALHSQYINKILVSTEDTEIAQEAKRLDIEVLGRLDEFVHDNSIQEVDRLMIWTIKQLEQKGETIDIIVLLYPTAPLRSTSTIDEAIKKVMEDGYDSVLSVYEDTTYLWKKNGETVAPVNYDPKTRGPRQKESWNQWAENKAVYVMTRDLLMQSGCRLGGKIGCVEMTKMESIDIDKPEDLILCDMILKRKISKSFLRKKVNL